MSYEHSTTDTHHDTVLEPAEQTILDIVEERFWKPYEELVNRRAQHQKVGLDTTALDKEIEEFDDLYLRLGGAELTSAENDVNNADNTKQARSAESRFHRAQEKFYANLQKYDGIDETTVEPAETMPAEPVIVESPTPVEQPRESESTTTETTASIKVGDIVWYQPKPSEDGTKQPWNNDWKVVKILPPIEKNPNELAVVERDGVQHRVSMATLERFQEWRQSKKTDKTPKASEKPAETPAPKSSTDKSEPVITPKTPAQPKRMRGGTHQRKDGTFVVESKAEHQEEFLIALEDKLNEMIMHGRMTEEQAAARLEDGRNVTGGLTGHAVKDAFRFANADPAIKEHDRRTAHENQLAKADRPVFGDDKTNKWFSDIMENTSISQAQKEYLLSFGPEGPQRDKIDVNEIKRQLDAEGFDYSNIAPAEPLDENLQAELGDARAALGLAPSESLNSGQSNELASAREALGLPAEKKVKVGRALLKSAGSLTRKSYNGARETVKNRGGWIGSSERDTPEKTDEEKARDEKAKKAGRKTWSIFAREEKPKSDEKIKKYALRANKKLSKSLQRRQKRRG